MLQETKVDVHYMDRENCINRILRPFGITPGEAEICAENANTHSPICNVSRVLGHVVKK